MSSLLINESLSPGNVRKDGGKRRGGTGGGDSGLGKRETRMVFLAEGEDEKKIAK